MSALKNEIMYVSVKLSATGPIIVGVMDDLIQKVIPKLLQKEQSMSQVLQISKILEKSMAEITDALKKLQGLALVETIENNQEKPKSEKEKVS